MKGKRKLGLATILISMLVLVTMMAGFTACKKPPEMGELIELHSDLTKLPAAQCIDCHGNKAEETSLQADIKTPHTIHIPIVKECNVCHKKADLLEGSAATLRKQVDPQTCKGCHGSGGPGPQLYQVEPTLSE